MCVRRCMIYIVTPNREGESALDLSFLFVTFHLFTSPLYLLSSRLLFAVSHLPRVLYQLILQSTRSALFSTLISPTLSFLSLIPHSEALPFARKHAVLPTMCR